MNDPKAEAVYHGKPHKFPQSAIGEEILGWECQACGDWIREFGPYEPGECSVDWRSGGAS